MRDFLEEVHIKECLFCKTRKKILQCEVIETHIPNLTIAFSKLVRTQPGWILSPLVSSRGYAVDIVSDDDIFHL